MPTFAQKLENAWHGHRDERDTTPMKKLPCRVPPCIKKKRKMTKHVTAQVNPDVPFFSLDAE